MDLVESFEQRFAFSPPDAYCKLSEHGSDSVWSRLPGFHWLTAKEVSQYEFLDHQWGDDFVPFGRNLADDLWCWWPKQAKSGNVPIVFCPSDCEEGEVYAPDFASGLFRLVCETVGEMSMHPDGVKSARNLATNWVLFADQIWPAAWREFLQNLATQPVSKWTQRGQLRTGLLPDTAYRQLLEWIDDGEIGTVFRWMTSP